LAAAIRDYLTTYGLQQDLLEYQHPTWQERPEIAIGLLQAMLRSGIDGRAERENLLRTADDAIAAARARMAGYPEPVRVEFERTPQRYDGGPAREPDAPNQITGTPGSRGITRGAARVALTLEEARDLEAGEILVATTTLPSWTPLFAAAAAIVTETGGPLSHS